MKSMPDRVISRWMSFALALAVLASLAAWLVFAGPFGGGGCAQERSPHGGESATATPGPQAEAGGVTPTKFAGVYDPGGGLRAGEPGRALRVRVVEEDHAERGVPNARVNGWRIARVPPGYGMPPSDNLSDGRARTDAEGRATVKRITRRAVYLQVTASGFTMVRRILPAADEAETRVEVALARGSVLAGRVLRADGTAAVGAKVQGTQSEQWGWVEDSHEAVTDSLGAFRLAGLFPGLVSLHATLHDGDAVWVGDATADAGAIDAEVRLAAEPTRRRVRLLVTGADRLPVAWARWDAEDGLYIPEWRSSSHGLVENGEFDLVADPDVQWVTIEFPRDKDGAIAWAPMIVGPLGARGGNLEVVARRGVALTGTVRDEQGKPMGHVDVFVKPLFHDGEGEREVSHPLLLEFSDSEGHFRLERVPSGRVEISAMKEDWSFDGGGRVTAPSGPIDFVGHPRRHVKGSVRHTDGTPAPEAVVYARGVDPAPKEWVRGDVGRDGNFTVYDQRGAVRLRAGLSPTAPEDMGASEVEVNAGADPATVVLTVPTSRDLRVRIPGWPAAATEAARLVNGPYSRGDSEWVVGGIARFDGIDPRAPLSFYGGPLPDGRIAFSPDLSQSGAEATLPLVPSRSIHGRARGFPADARPDSVWADTSAFEARGEVDADGTFLVRGVPIGGCRVCIVFRRGEEAWAGSIGDTGSADPVDVEVRPMDETALSAWRVARPPP